VYKSRIPALEKNRETELQEFLLIFSTKLFYKFFFRNLKIKHGIRALNLIPKRGVNCENSLIKTVAYSKW